MLRRLPAALILFVLAALIPVSPSVSQAKAGGVIEEFHAVLLSVMRDADALGYQGRYDRLAPVIDKTLDIPLMARWAVGRHWEEMSGDQRGRLTAAFRGFTIANYANRFDDFNGEDFVTVAEDKTKRGDTLVRTQIVKRSGKKINLFYVMREEKDGWRVVDIFSKGVSQLATRRSEYTSFLRNASADSLISAIQDKTSRLVTP